MEPTILVSLMLGFIVVMLGAFYVKQGVEQAEMKRAVQVAYHQKNAQRLLRAIDSIPQQYSNIALQHFFLEEVQRELSNILQISPKMSFVHRELSVIQERLGQLMQSGQNSAIETADIKTLEDANNIRSHAQNLLKYVHQRYQANLLSKDIAQQLSNHLKKIIAQAALDLYLSKANSLNNEKKHQMALPFYQRAAQELIKHPYIERNQELTKMVNEKIKSMQELDQKQRDDEVANEEATLGDGVDSIIEEEEEKWKKKYF